MSQSLKQEQADFLLRYHLAEQKAKIKADLMIELCLDSANPLDTLYPMLIDVLRDNYMYMSEPINHLRSIDQSRFYTPFKQSLAEEDKPF